MCFRTLQLNKEISASRFKQFTYFLLKYLTCPAWNYATGGGERTIQNNAALKKMKTLAALNNEVPIKIKPKDTQYTQQ